jgi:hypothetical protein
MIEILDANATYHYPTNEQRKNQEANETLSTPKSLLSQQPQGTSLTMDTILLGSSLKHNTSALDEQLRAKFLTRLFREYRRNLEREHLLSQQASTRQTQPQILLSYQEPEAGEGLASVSSGNNQ